MPYIQPIKEEREKGRLLMAAKRNNTNGEITVDISVTLGTADLRVNQLLKLGRGAVVELDDVIEHEHMSTSMPTMF